MVGDKLYRIDYEEIRSFCEFITADSQDAATKMFAEKLNKDDYIPHYSEVILLDVISNDPDDEKDRTEAQNENAWGQV